MTPAVPTLVEKWETIPFPESDPEFYVPYHLDLAKSMQVNIVPAEPNQSGTPFFVQHPSFVRFTLAGYQEGRKYSLPFSSQQPTVAIYKTQDFAGYTNEGPHDYPRTMEHLKKLLAEGVVPEHCAKPLLSYETELPFLPVVNAKQTFCAQPKIVTFSGGKGLRYITYYSQGVGPALDWFVFYTFQGLTDDGRYYISTALPLDTNIFPDEPPVMEVSPDLEVMANLLEQQVRDLNTMPSGQFGPSLDQLDEWMGRIRVEHNTP